MFVVDRVGILNLSEDCIEVHAISGAVYQDICSAAVSDICHFVIHSCCSYTLFESRCAPARGTARRGGSRADRSKSTDAGCV